MKEETSMNVWKESFVIEVRFLTRNDYLQKVAGNWTWPETGAHTELEAKNKKTIKLPLNLNLCAGVKRYSSAIF